MRKNEVKKDNKKIETNRQWFNAAPPARGKLHWVPYNSASELADYFLAYPGEVPVEIDELLDGTQVSKEASFISIPEEKTELTKDLFGIGGPRNHDILMVANGEVVIGIEAKATESLDKYMSAYENKKGNAELRYNGLCEQILSKDISECKNIRYQLLSAAAGTIIEAANRNINKAILLVILFKSKIVSPFHVEATRKNVEDFKQALRENGLNSSSSKCFKTPFAQKYLSKDIDLYVEFIDVCVCSYQNKLKEK